MLFFQISIKKTCFAKQSERLKVNEKVLNSYFGGVKLNFKVSKLIGI